MTSPKSWDCLELVSSEGGLQMRVIKGPQPGCQPFKGRVLLPIAAGEEIQQLSGVI